MGRWTRAQLARFFGQANWACFGPKKLDSTQIYPLARLARTGLVRPNPAHLPALDRILYCSICFPSDSIAQKWYYVYNNKDSIVCIALSCVMKQVKEHKMKQKKLPYDRASSQS